MASSISRPQSAAAPRSPLSTAGYTSPLKYASNYAPNQLHTDPFASESRKFLSSRKGERPYPLESDQQRQRSGSYNSAHPPPLPERMYSGSAGRNQQQLSAAEIGRSTTAIPRNYPDPTSPKSSLYPSHMLPPKQSTISPFSNYREPSSIDDPYASHRYRSPLHSPTPSSIASTNSTSSPPPSLPHSPTRPLHHVSHHHNGAHGLAHGQGHHSASHASHGRTHSLSTNAYATDYAGGSSSKLLPTSRGIPSKRHTQAYPSSHSSSHHSHSNGYGLGLGAVGPALAQNIPPVLPRPPSVKGTSAASGLRRGDSLVGRNGNGTVRKGEKTITDEEQAAYAALNTYR